MRYARKVKLKRAVALILVQAIYLQYLPLFLHIAGSRMVRRPVCAVEGYYEFDVICRRTAHEGHV